MFKFSELLVSRAFSVRCIMIGGTYYVSAALTGVTLGIVTIAADIVGDIMFDSDELKIELSSEDLPSTDFSLCLASARHLLASSLNISRSVTEIQAEFDHELRQLQVNHDNALACLRAQHAIEVQQTVRSVRTQSLVISQANLHLQLAEQHSLHEQTVTGHGAELRRQARQQLNKMTTQHKSDLQSVRDDRQLKQTEDRLSAKHQADMQTLRMENASAHEKTVADFKSNVQLVEKQAEALRSQLAEEEVPAEQLRAHIDAEELNKRSMEQECQDLKGQLAQLQANLAQQQREAEQVATTKLTLPYQSTYNKLWDEDTAVSSTAQELDGATMLSIAAIASAANASTLARSLISDISVRQVITNEVFDLFPDATGAPPSLPAPAALTPMKSFANVQPPAQPQTLFQTARSCWSSMGMQFVDTSAALRSSAPAHSLCDTSLMPDSPVARDSMTAASDRPFSGLSATRSRSDSSLQASPCARSAQQHGLATSSLS